MTRTSDLPQIGDRLEIKTLGIGNKNKYVSQLLDIIEPDIYVISGPIKNNRIVPFHAGSEIEVNYYRAGRGRFIFKALIKENEMNKIYKLTIEATTKVSKLQERDFYRLPISMQVIKKYILQSNNHEISEICVTEDISGGGMKLQTNCEHNIDETIQCGFKIDDIEVIVRGKIVRIGRSNNSQYKYVLGVKFIDLTKEEREKIIKFIFDKQLLLRKKGLI